MTTRAITPMALTVGGHPLRPLTADEVMRMVDPGRAVGGRHGPLDLRDLFAGL